MSKIDKIFKVHNGEIVPVPVIRETDKYVFIESQPCFAYSARLVKKHVCLTPMEAAQEEHNRAIEQIGMFRDGLEKARARRMTAKKLLTEARNENKNAA